MNTLRRLSDLLVFIACIVLLVVWVGAIWCAEPGSNPFGGLEEAHRD